MPELPEVETTRRGISPHIQHNTIRSVTIRNPRLRWPIDAALPKRLKGRIIDDVERRGKYLLIRVENGTLLWHLGMSGSLRILLQHEPPKTHDHVDITFNDGKILRYNDPRRFGAVVWTEAPAEEHALLHHLGPEPLEEEFNADYLYTKSRKRQQAIKSWIMDSKIVVGVGNIYANEALFYSGIHPLKAAGKITRKQCEKLVEEIKRILQAAILRGGTTLRDFVNSDGKPGYFAQELSVYGRGGEDCRQCGKALTEKQIAQRASVYCTICQK